MAVILEKIGDKHKVNLSKESISSDKEIVINLNWSKEKKEKKKGFFAKIASFLDTDIDLDLGCYYEMQDGQRMIIDGLQFSKAGGPRNKQTRQGCYTDYPYIWHAGDDRGTAGGDSGENIYVNPKGINEIKRMIIYTFIYEGVAKWSETNAVVTVKVPGGQEVVVEMGKQINLKKFCAIAELTFDGDDSITVKKLVTFHSGHEECDKAYGWGFKWTEGSK